MSAPYTKVIQFTSRWSKKGSFPQHPPDFTVSGLGCVFLTFDVHLARSSRDRIETQLLTGWAGV